MWTREPLSDQRTCLHCLSVHLRWLRAQRSFCRFCAKLINAFLFAYYNFKLHFLMQWQTVLSDNDFSKYSWANVAMSIMVAWWFLKQYRLRARWSPTFSSGFRPWPLHTEISPDSVNLFTILWTVNNSLQTCAEKHCLWTDWQFCHKVALWHSGTKWWTTANPCFQRLGLRWPLLLNSILITSPDKLLIMELMVTRRSEARAQSFACSSVSTFIS